MHRRAFLEVAAAGSLIAMPAVTRAQQAGKVYRIGFLSLQSGLTPTTETFPQGALGLIIPPPPLVRADQEIQ